MTQTKKMINVRNLSLVNKILRITKNYDTHKLSYGYGYDHGDRCITKIKENQYEFVILYTHNGFVSEFTIYKFALLSKKNENIFCIYIANKEKIEDEWDDITDQIERSKKLIEQYKASLEILYIDSVAQLRDHEQDTLNSLLHNKERSQENYDTFMKNKKKYFELKEKYETEN